ncbi:ATP-binding cassette domain-containing protein, partial [Enterococcus faecium]|uniref:ATP-binding cassette domain-containing protein n=1 Tax=Enterococcus faecium TaxID=1352 RepID=UPI00215782C4
VLFTLHRYLEKADDFVIVIENLFIKEIEREINCKFEEGITYLKGKNGSGKTLLLDYISGLRSPLPKNSKISNNTSCIYMRQNFTFYSRLTVNEFIHFIEGLTKESKRNFLYLLNTFFPNINFEKYKKKKLGLLSGGERRLIYILSILSIERKWYILDEPFSNLDQETREVLMVIIKTMNKEKKVNFILTAHENIPLDNLHVLDFNSI